MRREIPLATDIGIVGGGLAGLRIANLLARRLGREIEENRVRISLYAKEREHTYACGLLCVSLGLHPLTHYTRKLADFVHRRVRLVVDEVSAIDVDKGRIHGAETHRFDILVLATGAEPDFAFVPGLAEASHTFYTREGAPRLYEALRSFPGGRIVFFVATPFKGPAAPAEYLPLLSDFLTRRGVRERTELVYATPESTLHPREELSRWMETTFARLGVRVERNARPVAVHPEERYIETHLGTRIPFDLLIAIPPHRGARVVETANLPHTNGFVPVDPATGKLPEHDNVYVVGDAALTPWCKAGSTAHFMAETVVENLVHRLEGREEIARFDGKTAFFLFESLDRANFVSFTGGQGVRISPPSSLLAAAKFAYDEAYWLGILGLI
ncbi:MAG: FAD-dependent oxidoreductase [Brockia lithotrophica]|nr:FAD-dependent oxidoreductase [Brockia lithotrophica]